MDQGMIISRQDAPDGSAALSSSASCPPAENDTGYSENRPQTRVSAISQQGPAHVDMSAQYDDEQQQSSDQQQDQQDQHGPPSSKRRRVRPPDNGGSTALSAAHHNAASAAAPLLPTTAATIPGQSAAINPLLDCIPGMAFTYQVNPDGTSSFAYVSSYSRIIFHRTPEQIMTNGPDEIFGLIMREDRVSFHGTLLASLREGTVWDWTGRVEVPPPPISEEAMAAGNGGGASAAGEVRTVRFTSASPPIRHRSSSDGDDDIPSSSSSDCYTTIFHGVVLDVTAQQQQQQQQQQHIQAKQQHQQIVASTPPPPPTASAEMEAASSSESCSSSLRSVFDSAPHPIIALDASGIVTEWNRTAEILTGYAKHDAIGKNFVGEFVVGACRRDVLRMLDEVSHWEERSGSANRSSARGGKVGSGNGNTGGRGSASSATAASSFSSGGAGAEADPSCEATLQAMSGHPPVHLLLIASPKRESVDGSDATTTSAAGAAASCGGGVAGAVIIAQDMSKQHAALALHRSETEKGIMEWLSHEVRNPLSVAVEASRTLKEDPSDDPEENSNNLELICLSLGYIVELLTDMLDLNKCAEGKITMNPTVCRLREDIVLPTKRMLDQRRKSVDLIIDGGDEIWAYVDRLRLQQVLTNLIVNSMKYTSIGFIRVGIRRITREEIGGVHLECATGTRARYDLTQQQQPTMSSLFGEEEAASSSAKDGLGEYGEGGGILMSVSDSGSGIDPSNYPNLFERWKRLGSKTNGTGIGLCLCRSLMEVMGGRIFLSKTYNSGIPGNPGCQFCIVLPPTALELSSGGSNGDNVLVPGANDGSSANEGPAICTAALSKRLSRDKNKPDGALRASPSPDDRLMPAPPPRLSPTPDVTSEWNGGANQRVDVARENGVSYRDGKKVSFAPQLDDSSYVPQQAPNPYKPNSGSIVTGNGTGASAIADGGASSSPVQKPSGGTLISTAPAASSSHHHQADDPFHNTCLTGKFRLLVVDDDETFRIMFVRRLKRMFPNGIVDESPSGEDSIEKAKANVYDLITMDHFMALDEMNGADTIRGLRANNCDACIVGISGNTKTVHHLEAGADDFVRKPVPVDRRFIRRLVTRMSPPAVWKVLIADDCKLNLKFMHRKLTKVSSPHYTAKKECEKRWQFTLKTNGEDCVECLKDEWFDLCVLDQHMGPGLKGTDVASFIREGAVNKSAVVVINTGVEKNLQAQGNWDDSTVPFNFQWTKPAPSVEKIRQDLCLELVAEKTTSGANFGESLTKAALLKASVIDNEAGLEDSSQETQDDGASSVISEGSTSEYDSSKLPEEEMKKLPEHRKVLQKLYDEIGDELAFCDMCNLFVATVPSQLDDIDRTLKGHDWNNLSLILHKLKGTLQVFHIVDCVALIKPLYEQSLVLKARGQKRKLRQDEPSSDDVADSELDQMRQSVEKLRNDVVAVIGVCKGVVDNGKQGETI